jgi:membrane protease YdiL (CAAX protease family)
VDIEWYRLSRMSPSQILKHPVVRILLAVAPIVLLQIVAQKLIPALRLAPHGLGALLVPVLLGVVVCLLYAGYVRVVERRGVVELGRGGAVVETARGFVIGTALFAATIAILLVAGVCTVERGEGWRALLFSFSAAIGAALAEEIIMRAIFFRIVEESLGTWIALALSAALFGLLHGFNPGATLTSIAAIALEAGVLLAGTFMLTRRLWMAIGMHTAWNFTEGGIFGASISGTTPHGLFTSRFAGPRLLTGGEFGPEASIVAVLLCLAVGIMLIVMARRRGHIIQPFWRRGR